VRCEEGDTEDRPESQERLCLATPEIKAEYSNWGVVKTIQNACPRREIIQLFREAEISCVENHAEDPARHSKI